jgi:hypothetical protein
MRNLKIKQNYGNYFKKIIFTKIKIKLILMIRYQFIRSIMTDALDRFIKSPRLHLLNSYINHEKLKNKFKALFELMVTEENKPNIQEEFSIYRYKNLIEEELVEND